ncbi:MAG: hypothetical protein LLG04_18345 [Parachlamydia sp.]|nr:hypothetical protein [Parachlamydia sp.]
MMSNPIRSADSGQPHFAAKGIPELEKIALFEKLVKVANEVLQPDRIVLESRDFDSKKDALAFLVEYCPTDDAEKWRALMNQLMVNLGSQKNKAKATWLLEDSVQPAIDAAVSDKIAQLEKNNPAAVQTWKNFLEVNRDTGRENPQRRERGEPVSFAGVPRELLPPWYLNRHGFLKKSLQ